MRIEIDINTGAVTEHDDGPVITPTIGSQLAAVEATFETKKVALSAQLSTVLLVNGPTEAAKTAELRTAYVEACNDKAAAIDALLFGGL